MIKEEQHKKTKFTHLQNKQLIKLQKPHYKIATVRQEGPKQEPQKKSVAETKKMITLSE